MAGKDLTPELAARYQIAVVSGSGADVATALPAKGRIALSGTETPAQIREKVVAVARELGLEKEWQTFLAQREPEVREKNDNVANYEKRPEPLTFQKPFNVKGSMERTQVPADLKLQLFASEPEIRKPIAMAWDDRGRCWVAETCDYPHGVNPEGRGNDTIRICEDTDGDGRADKFTVFADKLNIPTAIVFAKGGIIVSQPPRFLFLKDTNGDDKADVREEILTGWGIGDTHAQASNLHYGYDNWLYGAVGYSASRVPWRGRRSSSPRVPTASRQTALRWSSCTSSPTTRGGTATTLRETSLAARPTVRPSFTGVFLEPWCRMVCVR
nr:PVC-type heme-binding CxxCH protein [Verrucomicrobium spinosum]